VPRQATFAVSANGTWRAGRSALAPSWALVQRRSRSAIDGQIDADLARQGSWPTPPLLTIASALHRHFGHTPSDTGPVEQAPADAGGTGTGNACTYPWRHNRYSLR
jgi:hypothetical protein